MDSGIVDMVKRELSDIRFSQSETDRRTQDSLETVHNTLGHVVDRLAMIEGDLRAVRTAPPRRSRRPAAARARRAPMTAREAARACRARPPQAMRAAAEARIAESRRGTAPQEHFAAAPREFHAAQPPAPPAAADAAARDQRNPRAARRAAARRDRAGSAAGSSARAGHPADRADVVAVGAHRRLRKRDQRNFRGAPKEPVSTSSFIAAARRAAQAAAAAAAPTRRPADGRGQGRAAARPRSPPSDKRARPTDKEPSTITSKIRSLLVGASVVVIVLGTFKMAMTLLDTGSAPPMPAMEEFERAGAPAPAARREQRRAGDARARSALDDLADADRPAIEQYFRAQYAG